MAESDDAQVQRTSLLGLVRHHVTLVLTLIPILLSGLRIFAVANGDRPTLVTLLSTLDVKQCSSVRSLGCCPPRWGGGGDLLDSMAPAAIGIAPGWRRARNRSLMAGGVHHDSGADFVCPGSGQRLGQPAPLPVRGVLLSQARAKSGRSGRHYWCRIPRARVGPNNDNGIAAALLNGSSTGSGS
jgi:hypothetical protein